MAKGIKATLPVRKGEIRATPLPDASIQFSFKYLQTGHRKFCYRERPVSYFLKLLDRFQEVSQLTIKQIRTTHRVGLRCHSHIWSDTTEKNGFGLKGELSDSEGWQFQLSSNEHGRVHGFFIDNVFFVVWLDPEHKLYK